MTQCCAPRPLLSAASPRLPLLMTHTNWQLLEGALPFAHQLIVQPSFHHQTVLTTAPGLTTPSPQNALRRDEAMVKGLSQHSVTILGTAAQSMLHQDMASSALSHFQCHCRAVVLVTSPWKVFLQLSLYLHMLAMCSPH
jgi:hypothetical protein